MKKLAKFAAVIFTMAVGLSLMFHEACEVMDQQHVAPMIASNLEKHDFKIVDQKYCSETPADFKAGYACELFNAETIDGRKIRKVVSDRYQFKNLLLTKGYVPEESDSDPLWPLTLLAADAYDAYSLEYSSDYSEKWDYSFFNFVENYRMFTARFATAIFTHHYSEDNVILMDEEILIISTSDKLLIVKRIYEQFEEAHIFSM